MIRYLAVLVFLAGCSSTPCKNTPVFGEWEVSFIHDPGCPECQDGDGLIEFYNTEYFQKNCAPGCKCESNLVEPEASCTARYLKQDCGDTMLVCNVSEFSKHHAEGTCIYLGHGIDCSYALVMEALVP